LNCENIVGYFHRLYKKKREKGEFRVTLFSFWFAFVTIIWRKFVYVRCVILRTALGAAPRERPTANSIRIAAAVQKHSIRNKPALPACLPACGRSYSSSLSSSRAPCITRMGSEINRTFYHHGLFPRGRHSDTRKRLNRTIVTNFFWKIEKLARSLIFAYLYIIYWIKRLFFVQLFSSY